MSCENINLDAVSEEKLLGMRICELPLSISGTWLEECVNRLRAELRDREIAFCPEFYLSDEWLTPDGEPVVGIPFFLAHPALIRLEKKMMLEAEGSDKRWCMKLLRHETGHALNYAYKLHKRKRWREVFGPITKEYGDTYRFRPYSRNFVRHLEDYYAQYHPDEDFSETFAVWLDPESDWQNIYKGWKALRKLKFVDELMHSLKGKDPAIKSGEKHWRASAIRSTLGNYYKRKRRLSAEDFPDFHDTNLKMIFSQNGQHNPAAVRAKDVIKRNRKDIINSVSYWAGERKYLVDDVIDNLYRRSKDLNITVTDDEPTAVIKLSTYVAALVMNYSHTGRFRKKI
jgi:hypothetical protein